MESLRNVALAGLRAAFQLSERAKPVRTIDELNWLVIDILNRSAPPAPPAEPDLRQDLRAAHQARRAVERTGGDEATLKALDERITLLGALQASEPADTLAGSISTVAAERRFAVGANPALVPIGEHRSLRSTAADAMRGVPRRVTRAGTQPQRASQAQGQLRGQREALKLVKDFLAAQGTSSPEASRLDEYLDTRLTAIDATAPSLVGRRRPRPAATRGAWQPPAATPRATSGGRLRRRIKIENGQDGPA
ncbi:hypothetical protein ACPZ19_46190 [Amycolatopsis lurida]